MENLSSPERLHGMIIANASLLKSLVAVLPLEALQALLPELERDTESGRVFFVNSTASEEILDGYEKTAQQNLDFVRDQLRQKEAMQSPAGVRDWIKSRLRPTDSE